MKWLISNEPLNLRERNRSFVRNAINNGSRKSLAGEMPEQLVDDGAYGVRHTFPPASLNVEVEFCDSTS